MKSPFVSVDRIFSILLLILMNASISYSSESTEGMPSMPRILPKKVFNIDSTSFGEKLLEQRGFGDQEPAIRMQNLMMVGGSGYEGMEMNDPRPTKTQSESSGNAPQTGESKNLPANTLRIKIIKMPQKIKVGTNEIEFSSLPNQKLTAEVSMSTMDMGTETPAVEEIEKGLYRVKVPISMQGSWILKIKSLAGETSLSLSAIQGP